MFAKAISKYNRISPKKARLLTRPLKGMTVAEAYSFLNSINKRASYFLHQVLKSAFDNAHKKDANVKEEDLYISKVIADSGPTLKRYRAMSMGRAGMIRKRTSHFTVHLDILQTSKEQQKEQKKAGKRLSLFKRGAARGAQEGKKPPAAADKKPKRGTAQKKS